MQLSAYQMTKLPFVLYIVDIWIYGIIFAGMDETAMKTLLYNPGMDFFFKFINAFNGNNVSE